MNILSLRIEILAPGVIRTIDRIDFSQAAFVTSSLDTKMAAFLDKTEGLIVPDELIRSLDGSGRYLIFTNASGIADEAGWEGVDVNYTPNEVTWRFDFDEIQHQ